MRKTTAVIVAVLIVSLGICCWNLPASSAETPAFITATHACCAETAGSAPLMFHHDTVCKVETATLQSSSSSQSPVSHATFELPADPIMPESPSVLPSSHILPDDPPSFVVTHCHFIS